jgi:putative transposase
LNGSNTCGFLKLGKTRKPRKEEPFMGSVLRRVCKRKKSRRLGQVKVVDRSEYEGMELDSKVELILQLIPLGLMHVREVLEEEVKLLAGEKHVRKGVTEAGRRHGTNPGSVRIDGQRIGIEVPRVRGDRGEIPLRTYQTLHAGGGEVDEVLLRRVLYGISCRDYERAAEAIPGAIGLSSSSVSRSFVEASAARLREFQDRDLSGEDFVAIFLDGKRFAEATMVIAMGVTIKGEKRFLGFVETETENEKVLSVFLRSLLGRGLDISEGILAIIDGGKGLRAAVRRVFKNRSVVQRCMWHKRENVVSYLPKRDQVSWRRRLQRAMDRPTESEARSELDGVLGDLEEINQSAAASLREGFEEILTLHRLGVFALLGRSFKTTNCLENVNALVEDRCSRVDCWKNSKQRHRWLGTALMDIEPRLRRVIGMHHLLALRVALQRELKIEESAGSRARAA